MCLQKYSSYKNFSYNSYKSYSLVCFFTMLKTRKHIKSTAIIKVVDVIIFTNKCAWLSKFMNNLTIDVSISGKPISLLSILFTLFLDTNYLALFLSTLTMHKKIKSFMAQLYLFWGYWSKLLGTKSKSRPSLKNNVKVKYNKWPWHNFKHHLTQLLTLFWYITSNVKNKYKHYLLIAETLRHYPNLIRKFVQ